MIHFIKNNAIALLALFVALGGTATAVGVANNSVGTAQLKNKSVVTSKIGNGAVNRSKLRNQAVNNSKVAPRSLSADRLTSAAQASLKGAIAYAQVDDAGPFLVESRTRGIIDVDRPFPGHYCLRVSSSLESVVFDNNGNPIRPIIAVPEASGTAVPGIGPSVPVVMGWGDNSGCPAFRLRVTTEGNPDSSQTQNGTPSDQVSFFVMIP